MPVLSPDEMADFRALSEELGMPDTYELRRDTSTPDGEGGWSTVEATVEAGPCAVEAGMRRPDERALAERVQATTVYTITLPYATTATASDRLVAAGRTFEILGVFKDGYFGVDARAVCEERS